MQGLFKAHLVQLLASSAAASATASPASQAVGVLDEVGEEDAQAILLSLHLAVSAKELAILFTKQDCHLIDE